MKYGTPESYRIESRAKYLAQFKDIEAGREALGLRQETPRQKAHWKEILKRMRWYR
jgi:hypothetical protein